MVSLESRCYKTFTDQYIPCGCPDGYTPNQDGSGCTGPTTYCTDCIGKDGNGIGLQSGALLGDDTDTNSTGAANSGNYFQVCQVVYQDQFGNPSITPHQVGNSEVGIHGKNGTVFYNIPFGTPVGAQPSLSAYPIKNGSYNSITDSNSNAVTLNGTAVLDINTVWGNPSGTAGPITDPTKYSFGRLDNVGVWTKVPNYGGVSPAPSPAVMYPFNRFIGFSQCLPTVSSTGFYYIGFGADDLIKISISGGLYGTGPVTSNIVGSVLEGTLLFDFEVVTPNNAWIWHVFPIWLVAGESYTVYLQGSNTGAQAIFGAEIYGSSNTGLLQVADLKAFKDETALASYLLFSTKNTYSLPPLSSSATVTASDGVTLIPIFPIVDDGNLTNLGTYPAYTGFNCSPGSVPSNCGQNYGCYITPTSKCQSCFLLTSCDDPTKTYVVTPDSSYNFSQYVNKVIKITGNITFVNTCWTVTYSTHCTNSTLLTNISIQSYSSCSICNPEPYFTLQACSNQGTVSNTYTTGYDLSNYVGTSASIKISPDLGPYCWQVISKNNLPAPTGVNVNYISPSALNVELYTTCVQCNPICYILTECNGAHAPLKFKDDFSAYVASGSPLTPVIKISTFPGYCWTVSVASDCNNSTWLVEPDTTPLLPSLITEFADCCHCYELLCYTLTPCAGQAISAPIIVKSDLHKYVGSVVKDVKTSTTTYLSTICWTVSEPSYCSCPTDSIPTILTISAPYADCVCCLPQVPVPLPAIPRVLPAPVKDYTRTDLTKCDIDANINFAQSYWNVTKKYRFGISTCEWNKDVTQLWVRKSLSDLSFKIDPLYCLGTQESNSYGSPINSCNHPVSQTCHSCQPIFAGMPCRNEPIPQAYLLWSDGNILWYGYENPLINSTNT